MARMTNALQPMRQRPADEPHRTATTLELLYDLSLVVAFSVNGVQLAEAIAHGHLLQGLAAFGFVHICATLAWLSYTWIASGFDTDDWAVRLSVACQMLGILILATGVPPVYSGFIDGWHLGSKSIVGGYVVMRLSLVVLWLRVMRANPGQARTYRRQILWLVLAQAFWVLGTAGQPSALRLAAVSLVGLGIEIGVPTYLGLRRTVLPWHPHHLAERFGLLTIVTLGELVLGTSIAVAALYEQRGWSADTVTVLVSGLSIAFGFWWVYFSVPTGQALARGPQTVLSLSLLHLPIYAALVAAGAGLHVAALWIEGHSLTSSTGAVAAIALPLAAAKIILEAVNALAACRSVDRLRGLTSLLAPLALLAGALALAAAGASFALCLLVIALAPAVHLLGVELSIEDKP